MKNTATISYDHPLLQEAKKRGFVPGAKYKALKSEEVRQIVEGPCYYDCVYREVVIGGFVIARMLYRSMVDKPNNFIWSETLYTLDL